MKMLRDPLFWLIALFVALIFWLPYSQPLFAALFPQLPRPVYQQESFAALALAHFWLVGISSLFAVIIGTGAGIAVTRPWGAEFRPLVETIAAVGQTFPPVAVLAIAVPVIGFGLQPAIIALILYGVLPVLQATLAGLGAIDASVTEVAKGMGMSRGQRLRKVELPLAAPVILAGVRTSVIINIGTATIASTVGASTLGTPIIIGLSGFNTAYVIQGALLVALAAIIADRLFERLVQALSQQQLRDIYAGKITNWKDVGGKDQEIVAFQRGEDSGSQTLFKKLLIQGGTLMTPPSELAPAAMGELVDSIADYNNSANAIGFSVYYYIDQMYSKPGLRLLAVDGVTPSNDTLADGSYPLCNDFYAVIHPDAAADSPERRLYDWLDTDAGQDCIKKSGYVAVGPQTTVTIVD